MVAIRGMRTDAARNQDRILSAAEQAIEELGPGVSLEEIARRAGVGVATVYRRFGNRDGLVLAVVERVFRTEIEPATAVETDDPWRDFVGTLEATVSAFATRRTTVGLARGLLDLATMQTYLSSLDRPLRRAVAAGAVRPELRARDLAAVVIMALATVHSDDPEGLDRRRYLAILIDGLRPGQEPLPPLSPIAGA